MQSEEKFNRLYQYGIADIFVAGLFRGTKPVSELKHKGNFGIAAPDLIDGELTIHEGRVYHTFFSGETREEDDSYLTPLAFVTFFKADTSFCINSPANQSEILQKTEQNFPNKNGMYAIRIKGEFSYVKTRAFPRIEDREPFPPLASVLHTQRFFEYENIQGSLIGFHLPHYLNGTSVEGYHFHFLSEDMRNGGHVLNFSGALLNVEIANLISIDLEIPQDEAFREFDRKNINAEDLEKVERGH